MELYYKKCLKNIKDIYKLFFIGLNLSLIKSLYNIMATWPRYVILFIIIFNNIS